MKIKDAHFRNIYKKPIIIKDKDISHEIARTMLINTIFDDDLSNEELSEKINSIEINEEINSILVIPYIDHTAGMSFHMVTTAITNKNHTNILKRDDFLTMTNIRKDKVNDLEFEYLDNLDVNDDFNLDDYKPAINIANSYSNNEDIETLRFVEELDSSRNEDYPDDVGVLFYKEGLQIEKMWVRYESIIKTPLIEGILLNTPYQDFGVTGGDKVRFFPYKFEDEEEFILICNLDNKEKY